MAETRQKNDYLGRGATSRVYKLNKTQNAQASQEKTKSSKRKDKTISIHSNKFSKLNEHQSRSCSWKPVGIESLNQKHKHPHPDWCVVLSERTNKDRKAIGLAILAYYPSPSYACVVVECFVRLIGIKEFVKRVPKKSYSSCAHYLSKFWSYPSAVFYNNGPYKPIKPNYSVSLVCVWKCYKERKLAWLFLSCAPVQALSQNNTKQGSTVSFGCM